MHDAFEEIPCNLCGSIDVTIVFPSTLPQDLSMPLTQRFAPSDHASGNDRIVRCQQCGLAFASPRMRQEYVWQGYAEAPDERYAAQERERLKTFARAVRTIERFVPARGTLLDVGCAAGFFLKAAKDAGWDVEGIEPNRQLAAWGSARYGVPISSVDLLSAALPAGRYDAISLWDVLEHVTDPKAYVAEAARLLRPGGCVFVNFPDFGSILARIARKRWWFLSPVHLYYFTQRTLARYLVEAGLTVVTMRPYFQTLRLGYLLERLEPYSATAARVGSTTARTLRIANLPIRYYASQTLAVARKPIV